MNLVGFVNALLVNINLIAGLNDPQTKITPVGFLRMLYENNAATDINNLADLRAGHTRDIKVRYMQRGVESEVSSTDDCEISIKPEWKETTIPNTQFSKIGIFISDEDMRKYQEEASQTLAAGTPSAPLMRALYETLRVKINGLLQKMDTNLVTAQNSKWGKNIAYGKSTAQTIALGTTAGLNDGYVQLLADAQANEIADDLLICGSGKVTQYDIYQRIKNGVDASGIASLPLNAYYDPKAATIWGADHFGVFAKGMIGIVDWNKNVGSFAGEKGGSIFFTLPMPLQVGDKVLPITFDAQLKYEDCPTEDHGRGWILLISKNYALFNAPTDAFAATDRLNGMNGKTYTGATNGGYGDTVAYTEESDMYMLVYGMRSAISACGLEENITHTIQNLQYRQGGTSAYCVVKSVSFDRKQVFTGEYSGIPFFIQPNIFLFRINYKIITARRSCN